MRAGMMSQMQGDWYRVGFQSVRAIDVVDRNYSVVAELERGRWYPTVVTLSDGNMVIIGGAQEVGCDLNWVVDCMRPRMNGTPKR